MIEPFSRRERARRSSREPRVKAASAPRSGAWGSRNARAFWGNRAALKLAVAGWHTEEIETESPSATADSASIPAAQLARKHEKSPATVDPQRGFEGQDLAVARLPEGDMGGAVFTGLFQLDEAGAHPVGAEFRRTDLEVEVGLAAGFGDLRPACADFVAVAVAGIDAMIGGVLAHLVHGDDDEAGGDVEGLERAGEAAVCGFGEGAKGDSHFEVSYAVDRGTIPAMSPAKRPQRRAVHL